MTTRQTLLLADDDPAVTDSLVQFLERAGFHVLVAIDGKNALEKAQSLKMNDRWLAPSWRPPHA